SFKAKARARDGFETQETAEVSTCTAAALPILPSEPFSGVTKNSFRLSWEDGGNPAGTEFQAEVSSSSAFSWTTQSSAWAADLFVDFASLQDAATYYARVRARNSYNVETSYVSLGSTPTLVDAPGNMFFEEVNSTSIVLSAYFERTWWVGGDTAGINISCNTVYAGWQVYGGSWTNRAAPPLGRHSHSVASVNGKIYVIGGVNGSGNDLNFEYDPVADSWDTRARMPTPRSNLAVAVANNKIYAVGGINGSGLDTNEEYDPITNSWVTHAPMLTPRYYLAAASVKGKVYVFGGTGGTDINEEYDPATNAWVTKVPIPTARTAPVAAAFDGKIYVIGNSGSGINEEYNTISDSWVIKSTMPTGRSSFAAAVLGGKIYAMGGNNGTKDQNEAYDPVLDSWEARAPLLAGRNTLGGGTANGRIYLMGGNGTVNNCEEYAPGDSARFSSLIPNSVYAFKVKARDMFGRESSESVIFSTQTLVNPPGAGGEIFSSVDPVSLDITWENNSNSGDTLYYAQVSSMSDFSGSGDQGSGWTLSVTANFSGLKGNTTYYAQVRAKGLDSVETGYVSLGSTLTPTSLASPTLQDHFGVYSSSFQANWSDGANPGGTAYQAQISTDSGFGSIFATSETANTYAVFSSLLGFTTYYTRARAVYLDDQSYWTVLTATRTIIEAPAQIIIEGQETASLVASVYAPNPGFNELDGVAGINIAKDNVYQGWQTGGGSWVPKAPMGASRYDHGAGSYGGKIYAMGGWDGSDYMDIVREYDPVGNAWATRASMPTARRSFGVAVVRGKIYAIGGENGSFLNVNEEYDPATNTWLTRAPMLTSRGQFACAQTGQNIYAIGGFADGGRIDINEYYDPANNTWFTVAPMPTSRNSAQAGALRSKIYVIGGNNGEYLSLNEEYDPVSNAWITRAPMPTPREKFIAPVIGEKLFILGGWNGQFVSSSEVYDPSTNSWATRASILTPRRSLAGSAASGKIYAVGGYNGLTLDINEEYYPGTSYELPGLLPNTFYSLKAKAKDKLGRETSESPVITSCTAAALPTSVSDAFTSVFSSSLAVTWGNSNGNPVGTEYFIEISTLADFSGSGDLDSGWTTEYSSTFTTLNNNATYYARVNARNSDNIETDYLSLGSTMTYIQTPLGIDFLDLGFSSGTIAANAAFVNLNISPSGVNFSSNSGNDFTGWSQTNEHAFTDLSTNTVYEFAVKARDSLGRETILVLGSTCTFVDIPIASGLSNVSSAAIRADWLASTNPDGTIYQAEISSDSGFSYAGNITSSTINTYAVFGSGGEGSALVSNTTYYLQVKAVSFSNIETDFVNLGSTMTSITDPQASDPVYSSVSSDSIRVNWIDSANDPENVIYEADISSSANFDFSGDASSQTTNTYAVFGSLGVGSLSANTTFYTRVRAINPSVSNQSDYLIYNATSTLASDPSLDSLTLVSSVTVRFDWLADSNPEWTLYDAHISSDSNFTYAGDITSSTVNTYAVFGADGEGASLAPNTTYYLQAKAVNSNSVETNYIDFGSTITLAARPLM
ncbi:kelch repeat-containing protein, partial [Elusimicrobiota bacterium]